MRPSAIFWSCALRLRRDPLRAAPDRLSRATFRAMPTRMVPLKSASKPSRNFFDLSSGNLYSALCSVSTPITATTVPGIRFAAVERDRPAHRVADEDHSLETKLLDDGLHVRRETGNAPFLPVLARFPVPAQIDGDDAVVAGERIELVLPRLAIAAPAVKEDEGRFAFPADVVGDAQPVGGADS